VWKRWLGRPWKYTRSPFLPRLLCLVPCGRWNFLPDTGGIPRIHIESSLFVYVLIYIWGIKSTLFQSCSQNPYSHNRKENSRRFPPDITTLFLLTTPYTTSITPLAYSTAKVSHPIPLSAAKRFLVSISL